MKLPLQVTICDIPQSPALVSHIEKKAEKLDQFCDRIMSCRIVIKLSQKHQHQGKLFNVAIDITVPNEEIVVNRIQNEDVFIALRDAFSAARRQLQSVVRKRRGDVKNHDKVIVRITPSPEI